MRWWYRSVLLIVVAVMELSWLYPLLALLGRVVTGNEDALKPTVAFGAFLLALAVAELLSRWRIADRYQRIAVGVFILFTALLMIRSQVYSGVSLSNLRWIGSSLANLLRLERAMSRELFLLLATFTLWWRGASMSGRSLMAGDVGYHFRVGIILFIGLLLVQALSYRQDMTGWMVLLFLCGLMAVALARIKDGTPAGQKVGQFSPSWLLFLFLGAGGTLALGLLLTTLLTTETAVSRLLQPVLDILKTVVFFILVALSYVIVAVVNALVQLVLRAVASSGQRELETFALSPLKLPEWAQSQETVTLPWLQPLGQGFIALGVIALFVLLLVGVRRWRLGLSGGSDVWRESVWSSREVGQGLLKGLQSNLRQLAGLWSGRREQRAYSLATVRWIYASLLALAEQRGVQRTPSETPSEYLPTLLSAFPGWGTELHTLTEAYVNAHYGRVPDTEAELQVLRETWRHIQAWAEAQPENETVN